MNMGNFSWREQGKKLQLCYNLEEREIVDARGVGMTAEQETEGLLPYLFTAAAGERAFVYQVGKRPSLTGFLSSVVSKTEFLTLCQNMADSLIRLGQRGIDIQKLVYHISSIFLDKKDMRPVWIYLPLREYDAPETSFAELLRVMAFQAKPGSREDSFYTRELLNFLTANPMADLSGIKRFLEALLQRAVFDSQFRTQGSKKEKIRKRSRKEKNAGMAGNGPSAAFGFDGVPGYAGQVPGPMAFGMGAMGSGPSYGAFQTPDRRQEQVSREAVFGQRSGSTGDTGTGFELLRQQKEEQPVVRYAETVVLGEESEGTAVLGAEEARLIRVRTGETIPVDRPEFCLGSGMAGTDYVVSGNKAVSRSHAAVCCRSGQYYAEDKNSTNHTFINGKQLSPGTPEPLADGDILTLANEDFRFELLS